MIYMFCIVLFLVDIIIIIIVNYFISVILRLTFYILLKSSGLQRFGAAPETTPNVIYDTNFFPSSAFTLKRQFVTVCHGL